MAQMQFDLVSPERQLASVQATEVQIPGAEGDMTAMAEHLPLITTLRPGILRVVHSKGSDEYLVTGGFADISGESVTILAERAIAKADVTQELADSLFADLKAAQDATGTDSTAKMLADFQSTVSSLGFSV